MNNKYVKTAIHELMKAHSHDDSAETPLGLARYLIDSTDRPETIQRVRNVQSQNSEEKSGVYDQIYAQLLKLL